MSNPFPDSEAARSPKTPKAASGRKAFRRERRATYSLTTGAALPGASDAQGALVLPTGDDARAGVVPEPSNLALGGHALLILGAEGIREMRQRRAGTPS